MSQELLESRWDETKEALVIDPGEEPAMFAWRSASPERSTPGPLPYQMPKTPSYLACWGNSACCCVPQTAVAASSSLTPG